MTLAKKLGSTVVIQAVGALATTLAALIVARRYGPEGTGYINYVNSVTNLYASFGLFGFPQAFIYMINAHQVTHSWAVKLSTYYGLIVALISGMVIVVINWAGLSSFLQVDRFSETIILLSSICLLFHGLYRAIGLTRLSVNRFNVITILPSVFTTLFYVLMPSANYKDLLLAYLAATVISALAGYISIRQRDILNFKEILVRETGTQIRSALGYGFWSFISAITISLLISGTYMLLRKAGTNDELSGYFGTAYLVLSFGLLPLNMVVPVLFDTWSKVESEESLKNTYVRMAHFGSLLFLGGVIAAALLTRPVIMLVFGEKYLPAIAAIQVFAGGIYLYYQGRLLSALLLSQGDHRVVGMAAALRLIITLVAIWLGLAETPGMVALAWVIGEGGAMLWMLSVALSRLRWPALQMAGLSLSWLFGRVKAGAIGQLIWGT